MQILLYSDLQTTRVRRQFDKVMSALHHGQYQTVDLKKLKGKAFLRAKLDDTNRLLMRMAQFGGQPVLLVLEVILNHDYAKSRFLRGGHYQESDFVPFDIPGQRESTEKPLSDGTELESLRYINPISTTFHLLDKPISFNDDQAEILMGSLPAIVVGSAGSGKTVLTLEKMKRFPGKILYTSLSPYLVENARMLVGSHGYESEGQEIDFLSFKELLESVRLPSGREIDFSSFRVWLLGQRSSFKREHARKLYEEFRGVLTGSTADAEYLSEAEYLALGVKQSIFLDDERREVYQLFRRYVSFLGEGRYFDSSVIATRYRSHVAAEYDVIVADEVQDFTVAQLSFVLAFLKNSRNFLLCGDANQIVHPNFFSWSQVKTFFYQGDFGETAPDIIRILKTNFRNSQAVTAIANRLLIIKHRRFGSIDKESTYLVDAATNQIGSVSVVRPSPAVLKEFNERTRLSAKTAIVVLSDEQKEDARKLFDSPLIFSVHEAKGLEYDHVVLYGFMASARKEFAQIAEGVGPGDLQIDALEYRRARDKSDKSHEALKFYVNALYVALTRAVRSAVLIDNEVNHPLLTLLSVNEVTGTESLEGNESSLDDWQQEARRLELQGKQEQADRIRSTILKTEPVPWPVYRVDSLETLGAKVFGTGHPNKKDQLALLERSTLWNCGLPISQLAKQGYQFAAKQRKDAVEYIRGQHYNEFLGGRIATIEPKIRKHGIDYPNPFGESPLAIAAKLFKAEMVKELIHRGASTAWIGECGLSLPRLLLNELMMGVHPREEEAAYAVYEMVGRIPMRVKFGNRVYKLEPHQIEHLLLNLLMLLVPHNRKHLIDGYQPVLNVDDLVDAVAKVPNSIIPEERKKRKYLQYVLAKNEVRKDSPYNRRLVVRIKAGIYILNPALDIELGGEWIPVLDALKLAEQWRSCLLERNHLGAFEYNFLHTLPDSIRLGNFAGINPEDFDDRSNFVIKGDEAVAVT
jgi:hypothetical protein